MAFDLDAVLQHGIENNNSLHTDHINPRFAKSMGLIGFDRTYIRAQGPYMWDKDGVKYLDMLAGYGVYNMGRNHPAVRDALTDYLGRDMASLAQMEAPILSGVLAEELKKRTPGNFDYVYFTNSGAEGIETAIKFAHRATGRPTIVFTSSAFHGLSNGALALNGTEMFREGFEPFLSDTQKIPYNDLDALEDALKGKNVAAFVVEPIQGKGVRIPSPSYLKQAADLCHKYGSLFVADEVQTGMFRTGKFLASEHDGDVDADIVVLSKALSGGYVPVGAVLFRKKVYDKVFSSLERCVVHSSTFGQGGLAMVAGLASLQALDDENAGANAEKMGNRLGEGLLQLKGRFEFISDIRWRGLMVGIEFKSPKSLKLKSAWSTAHMMNADLFCQAITIPLLSDHKILTQVSGYNMDVIKLIPPLVISDADVDWFLNAFEDVMVKLHKFPGPAWSAIFQIGKNAVAASRS
ncbi:MAG: aspartate aminotransferase family protein [Proteobacteria bacterium]|nr:aspartate aminotransferase family protein [Pseudomonadota bacterium]